MIGLAVALKSHALVKMLVEAEANVHPIVPPLTVAVLHQDLEITSTLLKAIFWWFLASAVVLRKGSPASAGASAGIRACVGRYVNQNGWFSGPCLATLLPRLIEIARACNHSS